jgi:hypothetical protein
MYVQYSSQYQLPENSRKADNPALQKGLNAITSSLNYIGGTIGNALEVSFHCMSVSVYYYLTVNRKLFIVQLIIIEASRFS